MTRARDDLASSLTYQHPDSLVKDTEYLKVRVRGSVNQDGNGMPHNQGRKIQCILGPPRKIAVQFIVDAVSQVRLLEEGPFPGR